MGARCPKCGAWHTTAQGMPNVHWKHNLTPYHGMKDAGRLSEMCKCQCHTYQGTRDVLGLDEEVPF